MAVELYAGALDAGFAESMAEEIEKAFDEVRQQAGFLALPADARNRRELQTLFIAIARGVIRHLEKNEQAFRIKFSVGDSSFTTYPDIRVKS